MSARSPPPQMLSQMAPRPRGPVIALVRQRLTPDVPRLECRREPALNSPPLASERSLSSLVLRPSLWDRYSVPTVLVLAVTW